MNSDVLQFVAPIKLTAGAGERPVKITIKAYGGGSMNVAGFGPVVVDLAGLDFSRPVPLLAEHESNLAGLLGTGTASSNGRALVVNGVLSRGNALTKTIVAMHKDGVVFSASIGMQPTEQEHIAEGKTISINQQSIRAGRGGLTLVRRGVLRETSIVAVAADIDTSVAIAASSKGKAVMSDEPNTTDFLQTERDRTAAINAGCDTCFAGVAGQVLPDRVTAIRATAVSEGWGVERTENELLRVERDAFQLRDLRAARPAAPDVHGSGRDQTDQVLQAAFCRSAGLPNIEKHFKSDVLEAADQRRGVGLHELLLLAAAEGGYTGRPTITNGNLREVLRAAFSVHTITTLLTSVANKILLDGFNAIPQSWRQVAQIRAVSDFKQATAYRLTTGVEYQKVGPGGEIQHGTAGQESYTVQADTYARMLVLTRQDIINDDLGAFDDLRTRFGIGAAIALNKAFWTAWLAAYDGAAFWTAARGNLVTSATLAEAGLNSAVSAFRKLSAPDGNMMALEPKRLLVPPDLESTALKLYNSQEVRDTTASTNTPTANIYYQRFLPVVAPELSNSAYTGYSASTWYLLADPAVLASAIVCFLNGQQNPTIESADTDFDTLGIQMRGYHDFGCAMSEYRASVAAEAS